MSVKFNAWLALPDGAFPPDPWLESYGISLPLNHVIARDEFGKAASRVGDLRWNYTAYDSRKKQTFLYFDYWTTLGRRKIDETAVTPVRLSRIRELQFLMCKRIYHSDGSDLGLSALRLTLFTLWRIARFAEEHERSVRDVLERQDLLDACISAVPDSECDGFTNCLNFLCKLDAASDLGFQIATPLRLMELKVRGKRYRDDSKQFAPLPTRIYSQLITRLSVELDDIEEHKDRLIAALRESIARYRQAKTGNAMGKRLIPQYGLSAYLAKRDCADGLIGLIGAVSEIFHICKLQIHTFSGMRDDEAAHLPFHCMKIERRNGRRHALIVGVTTKLAGGRRMQTAWVTTEEDGFRAIRLAQDFAAVIYESIGVKTDERQVVKRDLPLFISPSYLPWGRFAAGEEKITRFQHKTLRSSKVPDALKTRLQPIIENDDIAELEDIDPFRAWSSEERFAVGQPWPLSTHQLRRSLALYARASGCVRLSSLRRQLQHISNDMSAYYGNGCAFAKNFLADDPDAFNKHIAFEWQNTEEEAALLAFVWDVLRSDEPLYGGAGNFYEMQREKGTLMTRVQVEAAIKVGTLSYKTGPLGGCIKVGACTGRMGLQMVDIACATDNCKNLVGKHSKIIQVIKAKRGMLDRMDKTTLTYRAEAEEMEELEQVEVRWRPQSGDATVLIEGRHA